MIAVPLPAAAPVAATTGFATPVLKWAGSKRWLAPLVGPAIRARLAWTGGRYLEPFLGGGAVALWLGPGPHLLGDAEAPLVELHRALADDASAVARALDRLVSRGTDRRTYLRIRASAPRTAAARAARLLYLNRTCYNGLYRTNAAGRFNVPHGRHARPVFPDRDALVQAGAALAAAHLIAGDFAPLVEAAGPGDVILADPPYAGGYTGYAGRVFGEADQARLAEALGRAARRGAAVIATNADTPAVRRAYAWAHAVPTAERRSISCRGTARGRARCLLLTSDPALVEAACA